MKTIGKTMCGALAVILVITLTGCMTWSGGAAKLVPDQKDVYTFSILKNAFATRQFVDKKRNEKIQNIMNEHGYKDYRILDTKSGLLINKDTFTVKFYRSKLVPAE